MDICGVQIAADNEIVRHTRANPHAIKQCHELPCNTSSSLGFHSGITQYRLRQNVKC